MKKILLLLSCFLSFNAFGGVNCEISNFNVEVYDHGGVYIHGSLEGGGVSWIVICGGSGGQNDCSTKATDRRLSLALSAQMAGKNLNAYFADLNSCADFSNYTRVTGLRIK